MFEAGRIVDERFEIIEPLGKGGFGVAFRAVQLGFQREVCLKFLSETSDETEQRRFLREARVLSTINHPNVVRCYAFGTAEGLPYLAMELVNGDTLQQRLRTRNVEFPDAIRILLQVCEGLNCVHTAGIIHRDLKPANILVLPSAEGPLAKIIDFGLAKPSVAIEEQALTQPGQTIGTVLYMSPEQCLAAELDTRSDLYAVGCVMYEMLCGTAPFANESPLSVMHAQVREPVPRLISPNKSCDRLTGHLQDILSQCMAKDAIDRPRSVVEIVPQLKEAEKSFQSIPAHDRVQLRFGYRRLNSGSYGVVPTATPRRIILGATLLCSIVVAASTMFLSWHSEDTLTVRDCIANGQAAIKTGHLDEVERQFLKAQSLAVRPDTSDYERNETLCLLADLWYRVKNYARVKQVCEQALSNPAGLTRKQRKLLERNLGLACYNLGDDTSAKDHLRIALRQWKLDEDYVDPDRMALAALVNLDLKDRNYADLGTMIIAIPKPLRIKGMADILGTVCEKIASHASARVLTGVFGAACIQYSAENKVAEALAYGKKAIAYARKTGDYGQIAGTSFQMILLLEGCDPLAGEKLAEDLIKDAETKHAVEPTYLASLYGKLGFLLWKRREFKLAIPALEKSMDVLDHLDKQFLIERCGQDIGATLQSLAICYQTQNRPDKADIALRRAIEWYRERGNESDANKCRNLLSKRAGGPNDDD